MATEAEARTKWCPFVQVSQGDEAFGTTITNRAETDPRADAVKCIASDCMMWRKWDKDALNYKSGQGADGFCGLGGEA